jgi:choline dehydrogenase-like flavoprotein
MNILNLAASKGNSLFETDLAIIGGGPAGLVIAREFVGTSTRVLILESGLLDETPEHAALAEVESVGEPSSDLQKQRRIAFHGANSQSWSHELQPYGVRCRALGGSTHAWAGKSAAFDQIDFVKRAWVPYSGWPIMRETLEPYLDRAASILNLGPNTYDDKLWEIIGIRPPDPRLDSDGLRSFFWQFARSRTNPLDVMRFGPEFAKIRADNIRVLLNATATRIELNGDGRNFETIEISTIDGVRSKVKARACVLAASGIENARLLLVSNDVKRCGIGNDFDMVGRFLMDHASARVGRFGGRDLSRISKRFGFYGLPYNGSTHMYMHGLAPTSTLQERHKLLNSSVYFMSENSVDDPWDALKRLVQRKSESFLRDLTSLVSGAGFLAKGSAMMTLSSPATPKFIKEFVVNSAIRLNPNLVAAEFLSRGVPHKLTGISIDAITEQRPDPESRVTLSVRKDRLGVPIAKVNWIINSDERITILRLAHLTRDAFSRAGLPVPLLEPWALAAQPDNCVVIDMAHTLGTTRMSDNPKLGVVDRHCAVHGVDSLYVAGGSVFPTSGHANPTLMIVALALRLADQIKLRLNRLA